MGELGALAIALSFVGAPLLLIIIVVVVVAAVMKR